ncbi:MAG: endonuclease MutS2 [Cyanobacterium sp. T60_A2020_053]|nr:endonuclease MutS2 [Cyanobacterium sp. T60_A2020_053]
MIEQETFRLLEWQRLCQHLSTFAATKLGVIASQNLGIPNRMEETLILLQQTKEVYRIESGYNPNWTFSGIHDISAPLERAKLGGLLNGEELLNLATTMAGMRKLRRVIDDLEDSPALSTLVENIRTFPELEQEIHYCIDDRGEITERASPDLAQIRQKVKGLRQNIQQTLQNMIQRHGNALQEPVIQQRGERFVLPLKADHSGQISGIVHDTSSTGSTLYIEPKSIIDLGNRLQTSKGQEKREEEKILRALTEKVALVWEELEQLLAMATALDLATAKARYSLWLEGNAPNFVDFERESITLRRLKHPLLVWQEKNEQGGQVIPIDVLVKPETRVVAITGPNTGGKTVTLKTLGIVALMAKVGLFIPAKEPVEIAWFDKVLADIGDEQSLEQSLSTFSGHIRRIIRILDELDTERASSLVLLDEVGAGTDPSEGSALAIAILKYLADHNLLTIATTHYGELKSLKYNDGRFENASVEFDDVSLQPTYRLLWGIPGRSNALIIAQRLGLLSAIIEESQELVGGYSQDVNQLISELENQRRAQEEKHQQAEDLLKKTERFYQEVEAKATSLQERERDLKSQQEQAVQKLLLDAKSQIAQVVKELQKKGNPSAQQAHEARENILKIEERFLTPVKKAKRVYKPKVGERVRILSIGQTAEVLAVAEGAEQLTARFGIMKMVIPFTDVESLDGKRFEKEEKAEVKPKKNLYQEKKPQSVAKVRTSRNTVDIRGQQVHLALPTLEKAISSATDFGLLWIVHGKGTGALRSGVHDFLQSHPQVSKYELAPKEEGGAGVTVAYLG